ncbi:MAG: 1-deoxy-D-xylulose-5-phosphate synthase [Lentisphaeria bacterium]|nr:1-deoxy-D-xylulose-5-phosphate synthase [Lentisphaeria bacterium]
MGKLLDTIHSPEDLRRLPKQVLPELAKEIREEILQTVSRTGGHLASSLGTVELTIALHRVFHTPEDALVWDVGHQSYTHKLLTGRRDLFRKLRQFEGCAPFQSRAESPEYDPIGGGHAGTAISAALGLETAARRMNKDTAFAAILGDGSLGCGVSLEGLNNIDENKSSLVIVLNDNRMSISGNVGGLTHYLNRIISGRSYTRFRALAKTMLKKMPEVYNAVRRFEESAKSVFLPGGWFEELGIRYLGPVDGHNIDELERLLTAARESRRPTLVHVLTRKGKGYIPAEKEPERYHGVKPFDPEKGLPDEPGKGFSHAFGQSMIRLAEKRQDVAAVTAAMALGTGLDRFAARFPKQFFDVGIAEEHELVFASGLAAGGMIPVAAIYATFLQRSLDEVYHDICLQKLPVILAIDRAGAVEDGPTHHGIYDLAFLQAMPGLTIYTPADEQELQDALFTAVELAAPAAIRYPRGGSPRAAEELPLPGRIRPGKAQIRKEGKDAALWSCGAEIFTALEAVEILQEKYGLSVMAVHSPTVKPLDGTLLQEHASRMPVFTLEDHVTTGGFGSAAAEKITVTHRFGWPADEVIPFGKVASLREKFGLTPEAIADVIAGFLKK